MGINIEVNITMKSVETSGPGAIAVEASNSVEQHRMLDGKTALITGSTSGIGLGIALALAEAGANIVLNGMEDRKGPMAQIADLGVKVGYHGADVSNPDEIAQMMAYVDSKFGGTDILVNNAGIQHTAKVEAFPPEMWDKIIAINQSAYFHTTRLALPGMYDKDWGRVINIASVQGLVGSEKKPAYVSAKHAVVGFTKTVALETAPSGITVNAICPGWVLTPLVQRQIADRSALNGISLDQASHDLLVEKQPSLRFTTVEQIGGMAVFLCSSYADNMCGSIITMDGGWTAQ